MQTKLLFRYPYLFSPLSRKSKIIETDTHFLTKLQTFIDFEENNWSDRKIHCVSYKVHKFFTGFYYATVDCARVWQFTQLSTMFGLRLVLIVPSLVICTNKMPTVLRLTRRSYYVESFLIPKRCLRVPAKRRGSLRAHN